MSNVDDPTTIDSPVDVDSGSDWEYEYSTTETEDLYVIIDLPQSAIAKDGKLSTGEPSVFADTRELRTAQKKRKQAQRHKARRRRRRNPETGQLEPLPEVPSDTEEEGEQERNDTSDSDADADAEADADADATGNMDGRDTSQARSESTRSASAKSKQQPDTTSLQLLNLASDAPLLRYAGRTWQLHWANGLGTDMYFVKRDADINSSRQSALSSFGSWDLVGCSAARLVASETTIRYKDRRTMEEERRRANPGDAQTPVPERQSFLRRLVELQVKKGEIKREDVIWPAEDASKSVVGAANGNSTSHVGFNMLLGNVDEDEDGMPVVVSTARKAKKPRRARAEAQVDTLAQPGRASSGSKK